MTNKQRAKIYRRAARMLFDGVANYCCPAIIFCAYGKYYPLWTSLRRDFREFQFFKPHETQKYFNLWWEMDELQPRILALLLCELIAKESSE